MTGVFFAAIPETQYSWDGGKTWRSDGPMCGPGMIMRIITIDGVVLYSAKVVEEPIPCSTCKGTGTGMCRYFKPEAK